MKKDWREIKQENDVMKKELSQFENKTVILQLLGTDMTYIYF